MTTPSVGPPGTFPGFVDKDFPQDDLYKCVHCGFCLNACPTYIETGLEAESPRGRLALMKAVNEGRLDITPQVVGHWDLCLQCRACEVACPSGVPYGRLMEATRTSVEQSFKRPRSERIGRAIGYRGILTSPALTKAAGAALKLYMKTGIRKFARKSGLLGLLPGDFEHLDNSLPSMSDQFFSAKGQVIRPRGVRRGKVALLAGCVMPLSHANTMEAATRVLAHNGVEVVVTSGQGCCGALNAHAGERESARAMARRNVDSFLSAEPDAIVTLSAGCGSTMKEYGELLHHDAEYAAKAERAASITRDIHEYLVGLPFTPPVTKVERRVTYQDACHLANAQRITEAPRELLRAIPGLELIELPESGICCGSAGTYSITQKEMSLRLGARKANNVTSTGAEVVATGNPGCAMQIENALRRVGSTTQVKYVVDLLDEAYGTSSTGD